MPTTHLTLSRRERQIMDILYRKGRATAAEVLEVLPDPPGYSTIRAILRILEEKGHVRHEMDGTKYVFVPSVHRDKAKKSAVRHLVQTFFDGSAEQAVAALLDLSTTGLSNEEVERMTRLIERSRSGNKS
jgi:predicted transcriptional regulator